MSSHPGDPNFVSMLFNTPASKISVLMLSDYPRFCLVSSPWQVSCNQSWDSNQWASLESQNPHANACVPAWQREWVPFLPLRVQCAAMALLRNPPTGMWYVRVVIMNLGLFFLRYTVKLGENTVSQPGCYHICKREIEEKKCCPGFWGTECHGKFFIFCHKF